jgi:hypothetical protein
MSDFNKRHYEAIALALQHSQPELGFGTCDAERGRERDTWLNVLAELANTFARDNGRFNRDRFEAACVRGANVRLRTNYIPLTREAPASLNVLRSTFPLAMRGK